MKKDSVYVIVLCVAMGVVLGLIISIMSLTIERDKIQIQILELQLEQMRSRK